MDEKLEPLRANGPAHLREDVPQPAFLISIWHIRSIYRSGFESWHPQKERSTIRLAFLVFIPFVPFLEPKTPLHKIRKVPFRLFCKVCKQVFARPPHTRFYLWPSESDWHPRF